MRDEITIRTIRQDVDRLTRAVNMATRAGNDELVAYFKNDLEIKQAQLQGAQEGQNCHDAKLHNPV